MGAKGEGAAEGKRQTAWEKEKGKEVSISGEKRPQNEGDGGVSKRKKKEKKKRTHHEEGVTKDAV